MNKFIKIADKLLNIKTFKNTVVLAQQIQTKDATTNRMKWVAVANSSKVISCAKSTVKKTMPNNVIEQLTQIIISSNNVNSTDLENAKIRFTFDGKPAILFDKVGYVNNEETLIKFYVK